MSKIKNMKDYIQLNNMKSSEINLLSFFFFNRKVLLLLKFPNYFQFDILVSSFKIMGKELHQIKLNFIYYLFLRHRNLYLDYCNCIIVILITEIRFKTDDRLKIFTWNVPVNFSLDLFGLCGFRLSNLNYIIYFTET